MRKKIILLFLLICSVTTYNNTRGDELLDELSERARAVVTLFTEGKYAEMTLYFDSTVKAALTPEQLEQLWGQLTAQLGTYSGQTGTRTEQIPDYNIVYVAMKFDKMKLDTKLVFDKNKQIAGFFFTPAPPDEPFKAADYIVPGAFSEKEVTIGKTPWQLPGTLTMPNGEGPFPAVILVHGSGPHDRDETIGPNKPFNDLALGLASNGIAVLRYDKRTKVHATKFSLTEEITIKEETIDDAVFAFEFLSQTEKIDPRKIFILGHSLGSMVMPRIGLKTPDADGFILMAGNSRPLEDLILEQYEYIYSLDTKPSVEKSTMIDSLKKQVAFLKSDRFTKDTPREQLPLGIPSGYWLDLKNYDQVRTARQLPQPLLILQGERDYQVTMQDFNGWKQGLEDKTNVTFISYPGLNHLFIIGEGKSTPDEYMQSGHVDKKVINDIAGWIKNL